MRLLKKDMLRLVGMPLAFIAVVIAAFIMPTGSDFDSLGDIKSIFVSDCNGNSNNITQPSKISDFYDWLIGVVPPQDICFVRENDDMLSPDALLSAVIDQTPDSMQGIDSNDTFLYSIYHMYIYITDDQTLYYNGVAYEIDAADAANLSAFIN